MRKIDKGNVTGVVALTLIGLLLGGYIWWNDCFNTPFQAVTLELGEPLPQITAFIKDGQTPKDPQFITDLQTLELTRPGEHAVTLRSRTAKQTVKLTVVDTTAPEVVFQDVLADREIPLSPEMFVEELRDFSATTVTFAQEPTVAEDAQTQVTVVVTDAYGNRTEGQCAVTYMWMRPALTLELGKALTKDMILLNPQRDGELLDQEQLNKITNGTVGTYTVTAVKEEVTCQCVVTVEDTVAPTLELKTVAMDSNQKLKIEQFVKKVSDASGDVKLSYQEKPDHTKEGSYKVVIIATDPSGNSTKGETSLKVSYDTTPPVFSGVKALTVKKGSKPNYEKGVKAKDSRDGEVKFSVDTSRVNVDKTGTYYAIYTATDSQGNKATYRRKITVGHGPEDTAKLIRDTAAKLPADPVTISNWVAKNIKYNSNWGGDDPIWYGYKNKKGNCYVHAKILEALLKEKGFKTQLIWVTDKSHYWNLVYVDGAWRHIDSTPGTKHPKYLMTDTQRYANLQGRNWDRENWPKCE